MPKRYQITLVLDVDEESKARDLMQRFIGASTMNGHALQAWSLDELIEGQGSKPVTVSVIANGAGPQLRRSGR